MNVRPRDTAVEQQQLLLLLLLELLELLLLLELELPAVMLDWGSLLLQVVLCLGDGRRTLW